MSYINNVTGYRKDILETRSEVHKGAWALIEPDGIVKNVIPGFVDCDTTILGSPRLGASFVDYVVTVHAGGGCEAGFGTEGVEVFLYVFNGHMERPSPMAVTSSAPPAPGSPSRTLATRTPSAFSTSASTSRLRAMRPTRSSRTSTMWTGPITRA